jgi:hypothetical protein
VRYLTIRLQLGVMGSEGKILDGGFCRFISAREAEDLEQRGDAIRIGHPKLSKKKRKRGMVQPSMLTYRLVPHPEPLRSFNEASPPSITRSDMLANVGITSGEGPANKKSIEKARAKIAVFAETSPRHILAEATP